MPDLSGKTVSEAIEAMNRANLNIKIIGNGIAFHQQYKPGAIVEAGQVVSVEFRNMDNKE
jgi:beta-lactam-binding protein with PASTA domain